jgi:hypothetical protein
MRQVRASTSARAGLCSGREGAVHGRTSSAIAVRDKRELVPPGMRPAWLPRPQQQRRGLPLSRTPPCLQAAGCQCRTQDAARERALAVLHVGLARLLEHGLMEVGSHDHWAYPPPGGDVTRERGAVAQYLRHGVEPPPQVRSDLDLDDDESARSFVDQQDVDPAASCRVLDREFERPGRWVAVRPSTAEPVLSPDVAETRRRDQPSRDLPRKDEFLVGQLTCRRAGG